MNDKIKLYEYSLKTPSILSVGLAKVFGSKGLISLQYDLTDFSKLKFNVADGDINFINQNNKSKYFIKDRLFTVDEFNYTNFFIVDDMLKSGNIPPKSYLYDRIKATIINQRKLDILKSINKEILNDALKSRKYEVYN